MFEASPSRRDVRSLHRGSARQAIFALRLHSFAPAREVNAECCSCSCYREKGGQGAGTAEGEA
jgi:hypothetical protein